MKIIRIYTKVLKAPLKRPFQTALRRVEELEDLVVIIHTDSGLIGYGEGSPTPVITGETMGTMNAVIDYISPMLIGKDFDEFDILIDIVQHSILKNTTAKSALEIALYDIKSQDKKLPLYKFLGGIKKDFITDITISLGEVDDMVKNSILAVNLGYSILKLKVGNNPLKDIDRVEEIYKAVGKSIILRLDANQGWSVDDTIRVMLEFERKNIKIELVEQPIHANNINGLKYIKDRIETPILADESIFTLDDAKRLLDIEAIDLINIKLAKCGGITNALKLADIADEYGVKCMMGCMLEGSISVGAGVHIASAKSNIITMLDLDAVSLCKINPVKGGVLFNESKITLNDTFGLGIRALSKTTL